jgi:hypothetical protein
MTPDAINRLRQAGEHRFITAEILRREKRRLAAVYFYGFSAEMIISAAVFRSQGFSPNAAISRDALHRRMVATRQIGLMSSDPHPLVGWALVLQHQKKLHDATSVTAARLREAVKQAAQIYKYWRPELRYKTTQFTDGTVTLVRRAASWFIENQDRL